MFSILWFYSPMVCFRNSKIKKSRWTFKKTSNDQIIYRITQVREEEFIKLVLYPSLR